MSDSDAARGARGAEPEALSADQPWYRQGLRFQCTRCGQCCTGPGGAVWVSREEEEALAAALGLDQETLRARYLKRLFGRNRLRERDESGDCIFLEDGRCRVYAQRPAQCQSYPWWPALLESPERWQEEARRCEGISDEAPLIPLETIEAQSIAPRGRR